MRNEREKEIGREKLLWREVRKVKRSLKRRRWAWRIQVAFSFRATGSEDPDGASQSFFAGLEIAVSQMGTNEA